MTRLSLSGWLRLKRLAIAAGVAFLVGGLALGDEEVRRDRRTSRAEDVDGAITFYSLILRNGTPEAQPPIVRDAKIVARNGRRRVVWDTARFEASTSALRQISTTMSTPRISPVAAPKFVDTLQSYVERVLGGKHITLAASRSGNRSSPPKLLATRIDGKLATLTLAKWRKLGGDWVLFGATTMVYDSAGHPRGAHAFKFRDDNGNRIGSSSSEDAFRRFASGAADAIARISARLQPRRLEAQYGPCGLLEQAAIAAAAAAAEAMSFAQEMQALCEVAMIESPETGQIVCLNAYLAQLEALNLETEAVLAQADYVMCIAMNMGPTSPPQGGLTSPPPARCTNEIGWYWDDEMEWWYYGEIITCTPPLMQ